MTGRKATFIGFIAILLWSSLALFTVGSAPVPPFQLSAMCFAVGGVIGIIWASATDTLGTLRDIPVRVYLFGTLGLFGYHAFYFAALRLAPPAEAGLIAYLWPLLIVLFSGLLPGERLRGGHYLGAVVSFAGAALILSGGAFGDGAPLGYLFAALCALTWSGYSVLSRRLGDVSSVSVTGFCLATALLSLLAHLGFEQTAWPVGNAGWASVLALGLGPVGLAFYVWDIGVKHGDIQLLGVASYAAPLLSTLVLIAAGVATPGWELPLAAVLIAAGAALAARASAAR